jgi:hypothetical protein
VFHTLGNLAHAHVILFERLASIFAGRRLAQAIHGVWRHLQLTGLKVNGEFF